MHLRPSLSFTGPTSVKGSNPHLSEVLIPIIRVIQPVEPPSPRISDHFPSGVRRWRMGDFNLQLPNRGLTQSTRLALARQGYATGSFRLNCSESLYAVDSQGRALYEKIELNEELETAVLLLREKPPQLHKQADQDGGKRASVGEALSVASPSTCINATSAGKRVSSDSICVASHKALLRKRMRERLTASAQKMSFSSSGLSSCVTFTEGLCSLEEYLHSEEDSETGHQESPLKASMSAETLSTKVDSIGRNKEKEENAIMNALPWLRSLSKMPRCKDLSLKKSSLGRISKSLTSWDLQRLSVCSIDFFRAPTSPRSGSEKKTQDDALDSEGLLFFEESDILADAELSSNMKAQMRRDSSWSKICRKFVRKQRRERERNKTSPQLGGSLSVASGLIAIFQQDFSVALKSETLQVS